MSYLNPAEDWERLQAEAPWLASMILMAPRSLFVPPPGVDGRQAYTEMFAALVSIMGHFVAIGLLIGAMQ